MASLVNRPNGHRWIQFTDSDGKRKTLRLGKIPKRDAVSIKVHVERLISSKITSQTIADETSRWIADISDAMRTKLVGVKLLQAGEKSRDVSLDVFVEEYCAERSNDCEASTVRKIRSSLKQLVHHIGPDVSISEISAPDTYRYQLDRRKTCAQASVSKDVKIAKTAFKHALKLGLISENPFDHLTAGTDVNPEGAHYIDIVDFERIIDACPDSTWRVIISLARIAGLRTPSELRGLSWRDINLATGVFMVTAPKTKRQRRVKLFPRLLKELEDHREITGEASEYVIDKRQYRSRDANLRTQLARILNDAGIPTFPRPFDNFRASASTDLATIYPIKTAADWLGHSVQTALKYYHMSRDRDLTPAEMDRIRSSFGNVVAKAKHNAKQCISASDSTEQEAESEELPKHAENDGFCSAVQLDAKPCEVREVTPTGLEPVLPA